MTTRHNAPDLVETAAMAEPLAPAWGWRGPDAGRASHVQAAAEFQATTTQVCGLYPYTAGSGSPTLGTPIGRHQLHGEVVCLDPLAWLRAGLVTNPGMFVLGQPGTGKSTLVKRLLVGAAATGQTPIILGDTKPDYTVLVNHLGGQVIHIGRGADRINPLDAGPLAELLERLPAEQAEPLRREIRGRRLSLLLALATLVRQTRITNAEEVVLAAAIDLLDALYSGSHRQPTVPDVLVLLEQAPAELQHAARASSPRAYRQQVSELVFTLDLLCNGQLAGVFDAPTTTPLDLAAPAISVDISAVGAAGEKLATAAMLCTWAYAHATIDAAAALHQLGHGPRRHFVAVMDELWRALRGAPGLVEHADALTRLNRAKGVASIMITHSLADLGALPTEADRAKAQGFAERAAIIVLAALPPRELARLSQITPLTGPEQQLVASWSAPESWQATARHPGRGKYLIKTGERLGIPVRLSLVGAEKDLYDTDQAVRAAVSEASESGR